MPNIFDPEFDTERDGDGAIKRQDFVGRKAGSDRIGATVWELEPGATAYKYHFHYGEEELLVVIQGAPTLRTPDGTSELAAGDIVSFPVGPEGAHQLINKSDSVIRFLAISAGDSTDVVKYLDTGETLVSHRRNDADGFKQILKDDA
ncbi:MAG: cupin domain-containing protein [Solirubrobacterales bacterium]|nr:cupin domain-containing protein [Solirubrobacterales bacterium]